jgi:hypothetical protein
MPIISLLQLLSSLELGMNIVFKLYNSAHLYSQFTLLNSMLCRQRSGIRDDLTLWDRVYNCPICGLSTDRDINAARNTYKSYLWARGK